MNLRGILSTIILSAIALVLTVTTVILTPLPLMLVRRNGGRLNFFIASLLGLGFIAWFGTPSIMVLFSAAVILTFVFCECENQNIGYSTAAFVSLLVVSGLGTIALGVVIQNNGFEPASFFTAQIDGALAQLKLPAGIKIDKDALVKQIPSALLIMVIFSIWLSSILVSRVEKLLGWVPTKQKHIFASSELRNWKLPDSFVWIALAAAAGTFFNKVEPESVHWLATNVFNVAVMLYFFQGLAVIVDFFIVKQVSVFWRAMAYFFIFSQLFLMVAFLGFVDLWMGFRNRQKSDKSAARNFGE
ncbi:MAG: DUF2232 domain-containing protein [Oligoflexia bacterium]|nr:DUF2232 domain-containing protein [Oligoflexia bacterium]